MEVQGLLPKETNTPNLSLSHFLSPWTEGFGFFFFFFFFGWVVWFWFFEIGCGGLYMLGPGSGTIWRCGLVGVGVLLWVWHTS